jgi:predicted phosphodiesterase
VKPPYPAEATSRNVATVRVTLGPRGEAWFLLRADAHHDNPHCDQALEKKHLEQAKDRGAWIIDAGDCFCAMQGKWDKRADKSCLRPEHHTADYLDALVKTAADFYAPYAGNWLVMGRGNHETAIQKRHETDLTERLVERINTKTGAKVQAGGYSGWVRFLFTYHSTKRDSRRLYYYHGTGGGGPVTRGVIQTNRLAVFNPDADVVLTGHTHDEWNVTIPRQRLSEGGVPFHDEQVHVRPPGYKDSWGDGFGGWEVEKCLGPKARGAAWLRFYTEGDNVKTDVTRAK